MKAIELWNCYIALVRRELVRILRIWVQTLVTPAITSVLYFLIFGELIGQRIGPMAGFSYIEFIVPGLVMLSVVNSSYANAASSFFSIKYMRNIEELLVSPTPEWLILFAYVTGTLIRASLVAIIVTFVSSFFVDLNIHSIGVVILTLLLTCLTLAFAGIINALLATNFEGINLIPTFVLIPLIYFGGVFYSTTLLSEFWEQMTHFNPLFYMVSSFRAGMLGSSDIQPMISLSILFAFAATLGVTAYVMMKKGVGIRE